MEGQLITPQSLIFSALAVVCILCGILMRFTVFSSQMAIFCSVGQGDASYIRIPPAFDILIDAGPDSSVLECLGAYMPFYDKTIDLAILSHPDKDHYGGYIDILSRYSIRYMIAPPIENDDPAFVPIRNRLLFEDTIFPVAGDHISFPSGELIFLWPTSTFIEGTTTLGTTPLRQAYESNNSYSLIFICTIDTVSILYTGDITPDLLPSVAIPADASIDILKVPHHGSKNGLTSAFLTAANPDVSIISAGKNNAHHHPSQEILDLFTTLKEPVLRTDTAGHIEVQIMPKKTPPYVLRYGGGN